MGVLYCDNFHKPRCSVLFNAENDMLAIISTNKTCDDSGKAVIDSLEDCKLLLPYATSYNRNVTTFKEEAKKYQEKYPRGCYIYDQKTLYFNPHETGKRNKHSQPICKKSK